MAEFTLPTSDPSLVPGATIAGFTLEGSESVDEIRGEALVFTHEATGLRLLWLANDDVERTFSIAFTTPPADDTGVFHILEHSVLDGSERYPVKEPFVELLKSSMATFLNAFTFPDKTMYPVASTNVDDLENLMDVYLDAVFHPNLYERRQIFEQEGWHLELEDPEAPLTRNGVVLNEMKGALSDPDDVLYLGVKQALFPNTCYRFESGGSPAAIPTLTYESYVASHARHYRPENAHAIFYGDLDLERELSFLDERLRNLRLPEPPGDPNPLELQEPTGWTSSVKTMATTPDHASVALGIVFATSGDHDKILGADVLLDAIAGSNESPLKRAVLQSGLGTEFVAYVVDACAQPFALFELKGAKEGSAEALRELVLSELERLAREGVGRGRLEASLASAEFALREAESSYPQGIALAMASLATWLYDEGDPLSYLRYEDVLGELKDGLSKGFFEGLLAELAGTDHACLVELRPQEGDAASREEAELAELKAALSADEIARIVAETKRLHELQATPDSPEALATLPRLSVSEIGEAPEPPALEKAEGAPLYTAEIDTHGIDYVRLSFDMADCGADDLPLLSILAMLLGKLGTASHTAEELDTLLEAEFGSLSFAFEVSPVWERPDEARLLFITSCSLLPEKLPSLAELAREIWLTTDFSDTERIRAILTQQKLGVEQGFIASGHVVALGRLAARYTLAGRLVEQCLGIEFYRYLSELVESFDERAEELSQSLAELARRVFRKDNVEIAAAGPSAKGIWASGVCAGLPDGDEAPLSPKGGLAVELPLLADPVEAFTMPSGVVYVGLSGRFSDIGLAASGSMIVASRALTYSYLWNEVRVLGGAYGAGFRTGDTGVGGFYSFRDPAVDPTLERYRQSARWLSEAPLAKEDVDGYIVACVGSLDRPLRPKAQLRDLISQRVRHVPPDARARQREQVLATTPEALRALGAPLESLVAKAGICCLGDASLIRASELADHATTLIGEAPGGGDDGRANQVGWRQARRPDPRLLGQAH